ncbi:hypothetical protein ACSSNL_00535 [Thalassobius sp. S69A]|uniref:hypothetical protein n=1 Tax=unclassified Thalassovita TaxID=2619711 RepID=UPI000C410468|nr:hypothetical protein [Paracoccaceae bacterium]
MPKPFITERNHAILLVPFLYAYFSRMKGLRGFGFNALTLWAPGLILTAGLTEASLGLILTLYFTGYLAFISVYELGYLMNDTWGLRHDSTPRRRIQVDYPKPFYPAFVLVRLGTVLTMGYVLGLLGMPAFWGVLALLGAAILAHNLLTREEFKMMTFFQMSLLRFSTPVFFATALTDAVWVMAVGALLFVFPRLLTYQDSKARLTIPERKLSDFALWNTLLAGPAIGVIYLISDQPAVLVTWVYYLIFTAALRVARQRFGKALS